MKRPVKFGLDSKSRTTGADIYVIVFQILSVLPALYIVIYPMMRGIAATSGVLSVLFSVGMSALPRAEALGLSFIYRLTAMEVIVHFCLLIGALAFGILSKRLLRGKPETAKVFRIVIAALIGADLVLRAIPLNFNNAFGVAGTVVGFVVRAGCLALLLLDLLIGKKKKEPQTEKEDQDNA